MDNWNEFKLDKSAFSIGGLNDDTDEKQFWLEKTPAERLQALEMMRQIIYGYDPSATRFERFFEIAELT